jgi:hypothetical protein
MPVILPVAHAVVECRAIFAEPDEPPSVFPRRAAGARREVDSGDVHAHDGLATAADEGGLSPFAADVSRPDSPGRANEARAGSRAQVDKPDHRSISKTNQVNSRVRSQ